MEGNSKHWEEVILDGLKDEALLNKAVSFLNSFKNVDTEWSVEHFKWKLLNNPAGRGFLSCAVSDGEVVGTACITLKKVWYKSRIIISGEAQDGYSHPDFRKKQEQRIADSKGEVSEAQNVSEYFKRSIFGRLFRNNTIRAIENGVDILYGTPNDNAKPGWEKHLNYLTYPMKEIGLVRPTARAIYSKFFSSINRIPFNLIYLGMQFIGNCIESMNYRFWRSRQRSLGYTIEITDQALEEFDDLWEKLKSQYSFSLVRDRQYFQHRFFDNPLEKYQVYKASQKGTICGIIVTNVKPLKDGSKMCYIADWIVDNSKTSLFPILLAHVIHDQSKNKNIIGFKTWARVEKSLINSFRKLGFLSRAEIPIIFYQNEFGKELFQEKPILDFTMASSDNV
jgi:hypothetical protein